MAANLLDASGCLCGGGECERCNLIADAFEAMREALQAATLPSSKALHTLYPDWFHVRCAALALADKVTRGR